MKTKIILVILLLSVEFNLLKADTLVSFNTDVIEPFDVHFINDNTGYICGTGGIYRSTNSGENWIYYYGPTNWGQDTTMGVYDFDFTSVGVGYAVGWRGVRINDTIWEFTGLILKTNNNGINWSDVLTVEIQKATLSDWWNTNLNLSVICIDPNNVIVGSNSSQYFKTIDGGKSWKQYSTNWNVIEEMLIYDQDVLLGGQLNRLTKSTNGGINWVDISGSQLNTSTKALGSLNSTIIVGGTEMSTWTFLSYSISTNMGTTWVNYISQDSGGFTDFLFVDDHRGYATARVAMSLRGIYPKGYILKTLDQGRTWEKIFEQPWAEMFAISKTQSYIFFVGVGVIKRLDLHMVNIESEEAHELPIKYCLSQNYPNPFNPTTKINFSIPKSGMVSLKVYNILGKEIMTLVNENMNIGPHEVRFDGSNLSSGTYFYKLETSEFVETKKMMFIK